MKPKTKTEIQNIEAAIKTIRASTWKTKDEMISALEGKLKDAKDRELVAKSDIPLNEYEISRELIKTANWSDSEKNRVLKNFDSMTAVEQAHEEIEATHRQAQIKEMLAQDPILNTLKSITKAHRRGDISQPEEIALLNNLFGGDLPE
jgi:hypothetical protein